ncbi:MAG: hypothetical protein AAFO63_08165 [Pseudomonadota bacterium]
MSRIWVFCSLAASIVPTSMAEGWACRNDAAEIICDAEQCAVSDVHTPMHVHFDERRISACAYTGCWEGNLQSTSTIGQFHWVTAEDVPYSTQPDSPADLALQLDRNTAVATLIVSGSFAMPLRCDPWTDPSASEASEPANSDLTNP